MNKIIAKEKLKGLNSLRFFAFLAIFLFHSLPSINYGYLGVDFFFILSSFLLTYLALNEIERTANFSKLNFFIRRALRIFPVYFLVVSFLIFVLPVIAKQFNIDIKLPEKPYLYFLFLSNFDKSDHLFALKLLWSIAVEEQFYILFILLSLFFRKFFWLPIVILLIVYFAYIQASTIIALDTYLLLVPHLINFVIGMICGYLYFKKKINLNIILSTFLITLYLSYLFIPTEVFFPVIFSILMASIIILIIELFNRYNKIMAKILFLPEKLGVYTYGLYVYSGIVISFSKNIYPINNLFFQIIFNFCLITLVAILSYNLYEKWFISLKEKFYLKNII